MVGRWLCFVVILLCVSAASADPIHLESSQFLSRIHDGNSWFVMFYAPWCGACAQVKPTWKDLSDHPTAKIGAVDCTTSTGLCRFFEIPGFPVFIFFHEGQQYTYRGPRTLDAFTKFIAGGYKDMDGDNIPPKDTLLPRDNDCWLATYILRATIVFYMVFCCRVLFRKHIG